MNKQLILFLSLFTLLFSSCKKLEDLSFSGIEDVKVISISQKGVEAILTAKIKNPNKVGLTIYNSDMNVQLEGIKVGKAALGKKVKIKANCEKSYSFNIKSDFENLSLADLPKIIGIALSKNLDVGIKGTMNVGKVFIKRAVPVDITKNVPLKGIHNAY